MGRRNNKFDGKRKLSGNTGLYDRNAVNKTDLSKMAAAMVDSKDSLDQDSIADEQGRTFFQSKSHRDKMGPRILLSALNEDHKAPKLNCNETPLKGMQVSPESPVYFSKFDKSTPK